VPNYRKDVAEVYTDTALSFIEDSQSLTVLAIIEGNEVWHCKCQSVIPGLPSWAPNWDQKFHGVRPMSFLDMPSAFRSARGFPHEHLHAKDLDLPHSRLLVKGKVVATIQHILSRNFDANRDYWDGLRVNLLVDEVLENSMPTNMAATSDQELCVLSWQMEPLVIHSHSPIQLTNTYMSLKRKMLSSLRMTN
jgi:hypothetical protein